MKTLTSLAVPAPHPSVDISHLAFVEGGYFPFEVNSLSTGPEAQRATSVELATVLTNLAYYGFAPSLKVVEELRQCTAMQLGMAWSLLIPVLREITGANREMGQFVVYKNYPDEVLALSEAEYWLNQLFMYLGAPNEWFTQSELLRPELDERLTLKVLDRLPPNAEQVVLSQLCTVRARWTDKQKQYSLHLARKSAAFDLDLANFGFKENGVRLIAGTLDIEGTVRLADATDVLRLAAVMCDAEPSLREAFQFRSFSREERRFLLGLLEASKNLLADFALRPALWKRALRALRPGDFKARFPSVVAAYDALYRGDYSSYNAKVEAQLRAGDSAVLDLLATRPGEFARRLHKAYALFGMPAIHAFAAVAGELTTTQLLKLRGYFVTINRRQHLLFPPKGNWGKLKVVENAKAPLSHQALRALTGAIDSTLAARLNSKFPQGIDLGDDTVNVKLQTNDQELAPYGRGTVFDIPKDMAFIRVASYWAHKAGGNSWFDNGVCFFDATWQGKGTCCWNSVHSLGDAAVFSGDPTNSKDLMGRACQMIDLNLDKLVAMGVRYAVWNVLCFSRVPFSAAEEVLATLQWGADPNAGKLFEPARAQMVFPLKGDNYVKYVAYIDVVERKLVYMDANLAGTVQSAQLNEQGLSTVMPAFVEYLESLPSVADLFMTANEGTVPVLYSDADRKLRTGQAAYVFKPTNPANSFKKLDLAELL